MHTEDRNDSHVGAVPAQMCFEPEEKIACIGCVTLLPFIRTKDLRRGD